MLISRYKRINLTKLRDACGVVNSVIAVAAARDIQKATGSGQLNELGRGWAKSFMERMGFVMRKATKTSKKLPPNFEELKENYLSNISSTVADNSIPADLIVNWDQTDMRIVPVNDWTMTTRGSKQVSVTALGDKREITMLTSVTMSGHLIPPQVSSIFIDNSAR